MTARIFTASWSTVGRFPSRIVPVRTSNGIPKWIAGAERLPVCELLIPPKWIAFGDVDAVRAEKAYRAGLYRRTAERISAELDRISERYGSTDLALCCFCTLDAQEQGCHRRWLSRWWEEQGQGRMPELSTLTAADGGQLTLVHTGNYREEEQP